MALPDQGATVRDRANGRTWTAVHRPRGKTMGLLETTDAGAHWLGAFLFVTGKCLRDNFEVIRVDV